MGPPRSTHHGLLLCLCRAASTQEPKELVGQEKYPTWSLGISRVRIWLTAVSEPERQRTAVLCWKPGVCGELWAPEKVEATRERERAQRGGRDARGDISSPPASYGVIKTNNSENLQTDTMQASHYRRKTELSAEEPSVENPDVLHSTALFFYLFIF